MSGSEFENILPSDGTLLYRARHWSEIFMKYSVEDNTKVIEEIPNEDDSENDEDSISDPDFEKNKSSNDSDDGSLKVEDLLNKTLKVIEKRKGEWEKTGIDNVLDTFCLKEIDDKVNSWLKTNENYLKSNNNNIYNKNMKKNSKIMIATTKNYKSLNRNRFYNDHDDDDDDDNDNDYSTDSSEENSNRKNKYRNKNKSYMNLSSSLESVDTAKYILSNRKPYKTKTNNMIIKGFCNSKNYKNKEEKRWEKLLKTKKLSLPSNRNTKLIKKRKERKRRQKLLMMNDDDDDDDSDDSEETDNDSDSDDSNEKCYVIPKRYFKSSNNKRLKIKNVYNYNDPSENSKFSKKKLDRNLDGKLRNRIIKNKSKQIQRMNTNLYNSNLIYSRRTPSPEISLINEMRLSQSMLSQRTKNPSQSLSFFIDDNISSKFNPGQEAIHSTEILNFNEMNNTKENNNDNSLSSTTTTISNLTKKIGRINTKLTVIHSPTISNKSLLNNTRDKRKNSINNNNNNNDISIDSVKSNKLKLTKELLEEAIGKNYTEKFLNNGETDLTKYELDANSEILFEPPAKNNSNNDETNSDSDPIGKLYKPKRGRIYEIISVASSSSSTTGQMTREKKTTTNENKI